jgi:hypothetical protein
VETESSNRLQVNLGRLKKTASISNMPQRTVGLAMADNDEGPMLYFRHFLLKVFTPRYFNFFFKMNTASLHNFGIFVKKRN